MTVLLAVYLRVCLIKISFQLNNGNIMEISLKFWKGLNALKSFQIFYRF